VADRFIIDKLTTEEELSGLFNLAVRRFGEIKERGSFNYSKTTEQVRREVMLKSNSIMEFINEYLTADMFSYITKSELEAIYADFCKKVNVNKVNETHVQNALSKKFPDSHTARLRVNHENTWVWRGVRWKSDESERLGAEVEHSVFWGAPTKKEVRHQSPTSPDISTKEEIRHHVPTAPTAPPPSLSSETKLVLDGVQTPGALGVTGALAANCAASIHFSSAKNSTRNEGEHKHLIIDTIENNSGVGVEGVVEKTGLSEQQVLGTMKDLETKGDIFQTAPNHWVVLK
jgi:hypothetical protein